jgi:hypothetical protein
MFCAKKVTKLPDLTVFIMYWKARVHEVYSHTQFIRIIHLHLLQNIAQIRLQIFDLMQNKYMLKQIFTSELIPALTFSHTGKYVLQIIRFEANIRKTSSEFHIPANIC